MADLFLEDFVVGQVFASTRPLRIEKDEMIAFAKKFDPQYFHIDEETARSSIFGGLVASGWHTAALTMRLLTERESKPAGGSIGLGFDELRWPIPVRPGDELRIESEVLDVRRSKSRPDLWADQDADADAQSARPSGARNCPKRHGAATSASRKTIRQMRLARRRDAEQYSMTLTCYHGERACVVR